MVKESILSLLAQIQEPEQSNNNVHLYLASAIFQSIIRKLNSLSIEVLT